MRGVVTCNNLEKMSSVHLTKVDQHILLYLAVQGREPRHPPGRCDAGRTRFRFRDSGKATNMSANRRTNFCCQQISYDPRSSYNDNMGDNMSSDIL